MEHVIESKVFVITTEVLIVWYLLWFEDSYTSFVFLFSILMEGFSTSLVDGGVRSSPYA